MTYTVNYSSGRITDELGNQGVFADSDPVYQGYVAYLLAGGTVEYVSDSAAVVTPLTHLEYMGLYTDAELETLYSLETSVPKVKVWLKKFEMSEYVDLNDPRTRAGVIGLEAAGLLATGRAAQILAGVTPVVPE